MNGSINDNKPKTTSDAKIMGLNLLVFAIYTAFCVASSSDGGFIAFLLSIAHFIVCFIAALAVQRWSWFLAGLIIVVIGFGTCVNTIHLGSMH